MKDNKKTQQLNDLKKSFYRFYNYMIQQEGSSIMLESVKKMVEEACCSNNIKMLKGIDREIKVMMRDILPALPTDGQDLIRELLSQDSIEREEKIQKIIRRGQIVNKKEYILILSRVEEIYSNEKQAAELEQLNRLLSNFEE